MQNTPPHRSSSVRYWLLALALVLVAGAAYALVRLQPAPATPAAPRATSTAPLSVVATSVPAAPAAATRPASPLVEQRDWLGLAGTFDPQAAMADIEWLCAPERAGREAGSPAGRQAAEYIAGRFEALGLQPAGDNGSYFQSFTVPLIEMAEVPTLTLTNADGKEFEARFVDDFMPVASGYFGAGVAEGPLVWANRGTADSLDGADIAGAVVVLAYPPDGEAYARVIQGQAAGLLIVREDAEAVRMGWAEREASRPKTMPRAYVGPDVASFMLAGSGHTLSQLKAESGLVQLPVTARLEVKTDEDPTAPAQNVLAVLPGSGRSEEVVVLGAHYDHLGTLPDGTYYPGANDNASGVAALLEIARSWREAGFVPERTVLFAAWDAEEKGLVGSSYFVRAPTFPLASIEAMLDLDMVGASPTPDLLIDGDGLVAEHSLAAAAELGVRAELANVGRSDHAPFRDAQVPASMYIWPAFDVGDYHRPSDTVETISLDLLRQTGSLAELVILRLSMAEPVPAALPVGEAVAPPTPGS